MEVATHWADAVAALIIAPIIIQKEAERSAARPYSGNSWHSRMLLTVDAVGCHVTKNRTDNRAHLGLPPGYGRLGVTRDVVAIRTCALVQPLSGMEAPTSTCSDPARDLSSSGRVCASVRTVTVGDVATPFVSTKPPIGRASPEGNPQIGTRAYESDIRSHRVRDSSGRGHGMRFRL